jgi:hypothetical protein
MNCAVHPDVPAVAYCRTCGKALCDTCKRDVRGVIYCEDCIAARVQGTVPASVPGAVPMVVPATGPSPALAVILAVIFPFGVASVYLGQYAKGLAHMIIFAVLVWAASGSGDTAGALFGIGIAFYYVYQIIDAYRSARALQLGQPAPDPFGLSGTFSAGEKVDMSKVPVGAVVLIIIGALFLMHNAGFFRMWWLGHLWPVVLIGLGVWMFLRRSGRVASPTGQNGANYSCACARCRYRAYTGPAVLVTLGVLFLLDQFTRAGFGETWPILLIIIGVVVFVQRTASTEGHTGNGAPQPPSAGGSEVPHV